jgi:hypothetical protein
MRISTSTMFGNTWQCARHRSIKQVRKYIRRGSLFKDNAAARSGL